MDGVQVIAEYWRRTQARDWDGVLALFAPDVEVDWPASGERFVGRDAYVGMNRAYPEGWTIQVQRIVADGSTVVSEALVPFTGGDLSAVTSWWEVEGGLVRRGREYWVTVGGETPPAWRSAFTTPYASDGAEPGVGEPDVGGGPS